MLRWRGRRLPSLPVADGRKPRETVARVPAPKVRLELTLDKPWQPRALGTPVRLGEEGREVRLAGSVEHRVPAALVGGARWDILWPRSPGRAGVVPRGRRTRIGWKAVGLESRWDQTRRRAACPKGYIMVTRGTAPTDRRGRLRPREAARA